MTKIAAKKIRTHRFEVLAGSGKPGPAGKQDAILRDMKQRIVSGQFPPGSRLPTRAELVKAYGVSILTVQSTLTKLQEEGFVDAQGSRGTFVTAKPPYLWNVGLVYQQLERKARAGVGPMLSRLVTDQAFKGPMRFKGYPIGLPGQSSEVVSGLLDDIAGHRLSGLLCESPYLPARGELASAIQNAGIPCVAVASGPQDYAGHIKRLVAEHSAMMERCVRIAASRGLQRVGFIENSLENDATRRLLDLTDALGLKCERRHIQAVDYHAPGNARPLAELMAGASPRIQALIVADDSLVDAVSQGLMDAGIKPSDELLLIAHANFPFLSPSALPCVRVGFDLDQVVDLAQQAIRAIQQGRQWPQTQPLDIRVDDHGLNPA